MKQNKGVGTTAFNSSNSRNYTGNGFRTVVAQQHAYLNDPHVEVPMLTKQEKIRRRRAALLRKIRGLG